LVESSEEPKPAEAQGQTRYSQRNPSRLEKRKKSGESLRKIAHPRNKKRVDNEVKTTRIYDDHKKTLTTAGNAKKRGKINRAKEKKRAQKNSGKERGRPTKDPYREIVSKRYHRSRQSESCRTHSTLSLRTRKMSGREGEGLGVLSIENTEGIIAETHNVIRNWLAPPPTASKRH